MKTCDELILTFQKELSELRKLEEQPWMADKQALWLKEIGRYCCIAEEILSTADLKLLKRRFDISERQWRSYKSRFVHHPPERD